MSEECANPLLLQWVKEWYEKAREQNSKGQFTYRKAYESLKACPLPYAHPSQAQELKGLGPKLCDRLTDKLKEHCAANGLPMPEDPRNKSRSTNTDLPVATEPATTTTSANGAISSIAAGPSRPARARKPRTYVPAQRSGAYAIMLALSTLPDAADDPRAGLTKNQIVDIAQAHCDSSFLAPSEPGRTYTAWSSIKTLTNKDLVCVGSGASKRYMLTEEGWDVVKRVWIAGGLNRARILAAAGTEVGASAAEVAPSGYEGDSLSGDRTPAAVGDASYAQNEEPSANQSGSAVTKRVIASANVEQHAFNLQGNQREDTGQMDRNPEPPAESSQPARKCFRMPSIEPPMLGLQPHKRILRPPRLADVITLSSDSRNSDDDLLDHLTGRASKRRRIEAQKMAIIEDHTASIPESSLPQIEQVQNRPLLTTNFVELISSSPPPAVRPRRAPLQEKDDRLLNAECSAALSRNKPILADEFVYLHEPLEQEAPLMSAPINLQANSKTNTAPVSATVFNAAANTPRPGIPQVPLDIEPVYISPGSYTIELLLDTREVRSRTDRTYLQDGLLAQGIRPHTRALELGDVSWIARVHDPVSLAALGISTSNGESSQACDTSAATTAAASAPAVEIVLPFILERKRLDDLIASLKDGRYREQKFRLRRSGLSNVTYLIEETSLSLEARQRWHDAVRSAIAATLAQDGFFVRRTRSLDESIRYLARLTRCVRAAYAEKGLWVLPERALERLEAPAKNRAQADALLEKWKASVVSGQAVRSADGQHVQKSEDILLTYPAFAARAAKDAARTVRAVYLRMLMATRGVTAWKARAIQRKYPTPKALGDAYAELRAQGVEAGRHQGVVNRELADMLARELGHWSFGRGKIGKAVSAKVAAVWAGIGD